MFGQNCNYLVFGIGQIVTGLQESGMEESIKTHWP